jgi:hypothetical protein
MGTLLRSAAALGLFAALRLPVSGEAEHCTRDHLNVAGSAVAASFCIPAEPAPSVSVTETFTALGKTIRQTTPLAIVAGARTSRTIDDVDLTPIGLKSSLHMTLAYRAGYVELEHALALPGAVPVK